MVRIEYREGPFAPDSDVGGAPPTEPALAAHELVSAGAIMTVPGPQPAQNLVGHLEWLESRRIFWFTAYGETLADGHLLDFDSLQVVEGRGIYFARQGNIVSQLTPIDQANVEDPDDYRIAWQLWQEVVPLRRPLIERCCTSLVRGLAVDGIDGMPWPRHSGALPAVNFTRARL
jgi:hypothetical protein